MEGRNGSARNHVLPNVIYLRSNLYICVLCGQVVLVTDNLYVNLNVGYISTSRRPYSANSTGNNRDGRMPIPESSRKIREYLVVCYGRT